MGVRTKLSYKSININSIKQNQKLKKKVWVGTMSRDKKKNALSFMWIKIHIQNDWNNDDLLYTNNLRYDLLKDIAPGFLTDAANKMVREKY